MMTRTNSSRCFSVLLALLVLAALAAPAAAISVSDESVPTDASVGTQIDASVTLTELYRNPQTESWELRGSTDLRNATWTVVYYDQTGSKVSQESAGGQNLSGLTVAADDGVAEVEVRITGTVPRVSDYSYDPPQQFRLMRLTQVREGGSTNVVETYQTHHYTAKSQDAREALDEAQAAIESTNANTDEAEDKFRQAVNAYESENFDLAVELANEAQQSAEQSQQSAQTRQTLIYVGVGVVVLALLVGGFLYWRSQQETYDKLG